MANYVFAPSPTFGCSEHPFATWNDGFSPDEIQQILHLGNKRLSKATIGGLTEEDDYSETRISEVSWINLEPETAWLYERIASIIRQLNGQFYKFDLHGFVEDFQFTVYDGEKLGHYTWHQDSGPSKDGFPPRKLSFVLQLSDPSEYEGGDLEILTTATPVAIEKKLGMIAVFPSYVLHRVTPVTKGIRRTLVVWVCGPQFK